MLSLYLSLLDNDDDKNKLEYLYRKYYALMLAAAYSRIKNRETAEDIVHDSILRIIKHLDKIDIQNEYKTKSFLCTVVIHLSIDRIRHDTAFQEESIDDMEYTLESQDPLPLDYIISKDGYRQLIGYISSLGDTYKTVCQLKYINGLKESQIAEILDLSPKTVNVRIYRARQQLITMIQKGRLQ